VQGAKNGDVGWKSRALARRYRFQTQRALALGLNLPRIAPQEIRTFFFTTVTHGRKSIFQATRNAELFLAIIADDRSKLRYSVHELVIMPDHVHLILTPAPDKSLEKAIQFIKGGFSFRAKRDLGISREIWQAGYTEHRIRGAEAW
jgi:putative transposase